MDQVARVVLAIEQHDVAEEVMHHLDRSGRARVVATAADDRQLAEALRQLEPDAVIGQPSLVAVGGAGPRAFIALDTRESVGALRAAIGAGARGFFVWPVDRDALSDAVAATLARPQALDRRAVVVAVHAARGGAGATFVATHVARAFARRGRACVLIDGDLTFGDVGAVLGSPEEGVRSLGDLVPLGAELVPTHLDDALWTHPEGFRVLLAPPSGEAEGVAATDLRRAVDVAASASDVVVLHLPRGVDECTRAGFECADRIVEVLTLDVLAFRGAKQMLDTLRPLGLDERLGFVVNRAARAEITPGDVERVFGSEPLSVIAVDRAVARAQDHGRLVSVRGRSARAFQRLAARLEEPVSPMP
jgi:pilus assembly protein CpaE